MSKTVGDCCYYAFIRLCTTVEKIISAGDYMYNEVLVSMIN